MNNLKYLQTIILLLLLSLFSHGQINFPDVNGWKKSETVTYNTETLWEYINGAADYYLNYSFEKLEVVEYQRKEDEYIKVEIYHHSSGLNAFGVYAFERPTETNYLEIGAEAYLEHSALNFFTRNWYVKIHTHLQDNDAISTLKTLAKKVSHLSGQEYSFPHQFDYLPIDYKTPHSEKYYPTNYLGFSFLTNSISADYQEENLKYTIFIAEGINQKQAVKMLQSYLSFVKSSESAKPEHIYKLEDMFNGTVYLNVVNNVLIGILNLDDPAKAEKIFYKVNPNLID